MPARSIYDGRLPPANTMILSNVSCVAGLLVLIHVLVISQTVVSYDGIQIIDRSHGDPVTTDHLSKESHVQQWSFQSVSPPGCPERCSCGTNETHHIINVDCSSTGLTIVPDLPPTTVVLSLENNSISNITCDSFKHLRSLQDLSLASNNISHLLPCVFQSQSGSLRSLSISDNNIEYLDVKIFQDLSQLKTLDLSVNIITHLANRTFSDLAQLTHLNLSFNFIDTIATDAFKGLRSLRTLSLLNNLLDNDTSFHRDVFKDLVALETLNVKANQGHLDNAISPLRNLAYLYMNPYYYMSGTPQLGTGYRQLINLQVLHMSTLRDRREDRYQKYVGSVCKINTVSSNFFDNIRTKKSFELYISRCLLSGIGNYTFNALPTLVTLDVSGNNFIDFGKDKQSWMASLINTEIHSLDLFFTYEFLDSHILKYSWFQDLAKTNLKMLSLKGNNIIDIATDIFPTSIEKLDVSENHMALHLLYQSYFFSDLRGFLKLRELHANDQQFDFATKQISQEIDLPHTNILQHSSSGYGHFKRVDEGAGTSVQSQLSDNDRMTGSQILNSSPNKTVDSHHMYKDENEFGNVWVAPSKFPLKEQDVNITDIYLPAHLEAIYARTTFYPVPKYVPHIRVINNTVLRHVDLSNNFLTSWLGPVENVPSLTFLNLSINNCDDVDVNFFKYMVSLETLILRKNNIGPSLAVDVSGVTFSTLTKLKMLDVSQNAVQDLSRLAFINNTNLKTLDLSYNRLTEFQPTLSTLRNLSFLDLSHNLLPGLSEQTCQELKLLKSRNKMFTVNLLENRLLFTCDYFPFLDLVFSKPHIFFSVEHLKFRHNNGTQFYYKVMVHHFPLLARECQIQRYFDVILIVFFVVVGTVTICAIIYHKRWKLRYLYYIGQRRMHIGEHVVDYVPAADVFITYDQDDLRWRRFMQQTFLPGLNQRDITYILGETDFPGGDLMAHVTVAVVGTRKTVVLLSVDIFDDHHREFEMNLSIMRELDTRSLKIIPIFVEEVDLALYPREIEIFLRNQWQRCLRYRDSDGFWDGFIDAVREDN